MKSRNTWVLLLLLLTSITLGWLLGASEQRLTTATTNKDVPSTQTPDAPSPQAQGAANRDTQQSDQQDPSPSGQPLTAFKQRLADGHYAHAVEQYLSIYRGTDAERQESWRQALLQAALKLNQMQQFRAAHDLLDNYLNFFYQDVSALSLAANAYHGLAQHDQEIEYLLRAWQHAHQYEHRLILRKRIEVAVKEQGDWLLREQGSAAAVAFYRALMQREPDQAGYRIALAQLFIKERDPQQALAVLENTYTEDNQAIVEDLQQRARRQLAGNEASRHAVPLIPMGESSVVEATINGGHHVRLLIDTGASLITLKPGLVQKLGAVSHNSALLLTANGAVRAPVFRLQELQVGQWRTNDILAAELALPDQRIDGLLGMNFLRRYQFTIDRQRGVLLLNLGQ